MDDEIGDRPRPDADRDREHAHERADQCKTLDRQPDSANRAGTDPSRQEASEQDGCNHALRRRGRTVRESGKEGPEMKRRGRRNVADSMSRNVRIDPAEGSSTVDGPRCAVDVAITEPPESGCTGPPRGASSRAGG